MGIFPILPQVSPTQAKPPCAFPPSVWQRALSPLEFGVSDICNDRGNSYSRLTDCANAVSGDAYVKGAATARCRCQHFGHVCRTII